MYPGIYGTDTPVFISRGFVLSLYSMSICDFERLNQAFFPLQSVGFLLAGIAVTGMVFFKQNRGERLYQIAAVPVFSGTVIFIVSIILGSLGLCGGLAVEGRRRGSIRSSVCFLLAFVFLLMMGYLGTKDFTKTSMNWISEGVNLFAQVFFLLASKELAKH